MGHLHDTKDVYLDLQRRVHKTGGGMPLGPNAIEILQHLFCLEEAQLAVRLPIVPRTLRTIARRTGKKPSELKPLLDHMADKGLVFDFHHPQKGDFYMLAPPVVGFFEFSMMRVRTDIDQKALAHLLSAYMYDQSAFMEEVAKGQTPIGRALIIEHTIEDITTEVLPFDRASELVKSATKLSVSLCYCRHKKEHLGEACKAPTEVCLSLGTGADFVLRHGHGRSISTGEALEVLQSCQEQGLVQIADNVRNEPAYLCNCCGCCCGQLSAINRHGLKGVVGTSGFIVKVSREKCTGCGSCARRCPIQALHLKPIPPHLRESPHKVRFSAELDDEICLGCGVCKSACKRDAIKMVPRKARLLTPQDTLERVLRMAMGRGNIHELLFDEEDGPKSAFLNHLIGAIERMPLTRKLLLNETLKSRFVQFMCGVARMDKRQPSELL